MIDHKEQDKTGILTNVYLYSSLGHEDKELQDLVVREEAEEVANCMRIAESVYLNHKVVKQCVMYGWLLRRITSATGLDFHAHGPNYWVCDGIIQGQGNTSAWEIGNSLQRNMHLDWFGKDRDAAIYLADLLKRNNDVDDDRWVYITHKEPQWSDTVLAPVVTSFFLHADESPTNTIRMLPVSMFQHSQSSKLRVLHLSHCTFSFASPPFMHCVQLRLLHLDHCTNITDDDEHPSRNENMSCFQKLWVLDLRYTEWYWLLSKKMKRLMVELRELNVEGVKHGSISDLCGGRPSLVILQVTADPVPAESGDTNSQAQFPNMSSANNLTASSFINDVLPPLLESFSFINKASTAAKISSISFRGCSWLKSIHLKGNLGSLQELDLSGAAVKTLDLREVEAPNLKCFILLGCEKLCAILWPPENKRTHVLKMLRINTIPSALLCQANSKEKISEASSAKRSSSILSVAATQPDIFSCNWCIAVRDARLLRSIEPLEKEPWLAYIFMEINSSPASRVAVGGSEVAKRIMSQQQPNNYLYARDIVFQDHLQDGAGNEVTVSWIRACPPRPTPSAEDWYVQIQDEQEMKGGLLQQEQSSIEGTSTSATIPPSSMCDKAVMLHVHDSLSITCIPCPQGPTWNYIQWCRVERCPNLCSVFATASKNAVRIIFFHLSTFWASQLPKACYIWNWSAVPQPGSHSFGYLVFLHLDYCPRLIHVLPLSEHMDTFPRLETLEIVCSGGAMNIF